MSVQVTVPGWLVVAERLAEGSQPSTSGAVTEKSLSEGLTSSSTGDTQSALAVNVTV
jgi:hypothetical protein